MQQAIKSIWTDELSEQLKQLALPPSRRAPGFTTGENVIRPSFAKDRPSSAPTQKPELSAALDAVVRAADLIKAAQERAEAAEQYARDLAEDGAARLRAAEQNAAALRERAEAAEQRLEAVTARAAEKLADADQQIRSVQEQCRREEERANFAEDRAATQMHEAETLLKEANDRVFAAETRTIEAKEDLVYLENYIRERFAL